jgi:hypothetical protein
VNNKATKLNGTKVAQDVFAGDTVKLVADISLNADWTPSVDDNGRLTNATGVHQWTAIGGFSGTFDGDNHELSGVYHVANSSQAGLFASLQVGSKVENLKLTDSYFITERDSSSNNNTWIEIGSITALLRGGTIKNVYSSAYVVGNCISMGGLAGRTQSRTASIENCWYDGELHVIGFAQNTFPGFVGGIAGNLQIGPKSSEGTTNITNCLFTGAISKKVQKTGNKVMYIGGIAGGCYDINRPAVLRNCLSAGTIYDVEDCAGALVGQLKCFDSSITGCYATTSTDCASPFYFKEAAVVNGVRWNTTEYENACSALMVNRNDILGDLAKTNMPLLINDTNTAWECVESRTPILSYFADWWFARQQ